MNLKSAILFASCTLVLSMDEIPMIPDEPTAERKLYAGFPVAIVCGDAPGSFPFLQDHIGIEVSNIEEEDNFGEFSDIEEEGPPQTLHPTDTDLVNCLIRRDGEIIFNQTIEWGDRLTRGVFAVADDSWDGAEIAVFAEWGIDGQLSTGFNIKVEEPEPFECAVPGMETENETVDVEGSIDLSCHGNYDMYMSEEQYNSLTVVWYRDCERIERSDPNYEYTVVPYKPYKYDGIQFDGLKILNASLRSTPGVFYCVLEQRQEERRKRDVDNKQLVLAKNRICLQQPYSYSNRPKIFRNQAEYEVEPGSSLTVTCHGNTGLDMNELSQSVHWKKFENGVDSFVRKCETFLTMRGNEKCSATLHKNKNYCEPLSVAEIEKVSSHPLRDNFTATFTIRHANAEADAGKYQCSLYTPHGSVSVNFTVIVRFKPTTHNALTVALTVVAVFVAIALICLLLLHTYRTDIHYFVKKIFVKERESTRPIAYLVYSPESFMRMDPNPVSAVTSFLGNNRFYNRNNASLNVEGDSAGNLIGDHAVDMLKQCLRMIVFLTPELYESNEIDIFDVYRGFEDNVRNNLRIVFICQSKKVKREIYSRADKNRQTCIAIRDFMQKSTVIYWDKKNPNRFRRALYVALPKVRSPARSTTDQDNCV